MLRLRRALRELSRQRLLAVGLSGTGGCEGPAAVAGLFTSSSNGAAPTLRMLLDCSSRTAEHRSWASGGVAAPWQCSSGSSGGSGSAWYSSGSGDGAALATGLAQPLLPTAVTAGSAAPVDELWRYLSQEQGFSQEAVSRLQRQYRPVRYDAAKVLRDLAPNIAVLRAEGLDTAAIEQLYAADWQLLMTTHETFSSSLAALRPLAELLPWDKRRLRAPEAATLLGKALCVFPGGSAWLLTTSGKRIAASQQLYMQRLKVPLADFALSTFQKSGLSVLRDVSAAETTITHLLQFVDEKEVAKLAVRSNVLNLAPAEFDRRLAAWGSGLGIEAGQVLDVLSCQPSLIALSDPAGSCEASIVALGGLLQSAAGGGGALRPSFRSRAVRLLLRAPGMLSTPASQLAPRWRVLASTGFTDSQIVGIIDRHPGLLTYDLTGPVFSQKLDWFDQVLHLSLADVIDVSPAYMTKSSTARMAVRVDFLVSRGLWDAFGDSKAKLNLLAGSQLQVFCRRVGCATDEFAAFELNWLCSPAGQRWGFKPRKGCSAALPVA